MKFVRTGLSKIAIANVYQIICIIVIKIQKLLWKYNEGNMPPYNIWTCAVVFLTGSKLFVYGYFFIFFSEYFLLYVWLPVPVQSIAWNQLSPKWPDCVKLNFAHSLSSCADQSLDSDRFEQLPVTSLFMSKAVYLSWHNTQAAKVKYIVVIDVTQYTVAALTTDRLRAAQCWSI